MYARKQKKHTQTQTHTHRDTHRHTNTMHTQSTVGLFAHSYMHTLFIYFPTDKLPSTHRAHIHTHAQVHTCTQEYTLAHTHGPWAMPVLHSVMHECVPNLKSIGVSN